MDISIIISNYDSKGRLLSCIDHALAQDAAAGEYEVIVPPHGSISGSELAWLQARAKDTGKLNLLAGRYDNRARALNDAVREASSEYLVFLESHVHAPPDLAGHYRRVLHSSDAAAVQGAFTAATSTNWISQTESNLRTQNCRRRRARGLPHDEFHLHSAGFRRGSLLAAGGFDERVPDIGEVTLLQRIQARGGRIVPLAAPPVLHFNHEDFRGYVQALHRRGCEVGRLWHLDPEMAARIYPLTALKRYALIVRRTRPLLCIAAKAQLSLASLILASMRALRLRRYTLSVAARVASAAVRAGFLAGYRG